MMFLKGMLQYNYNRRGAADECADVVQWVTCLQRAEDSAFTCSALRFSGGSWEVCHSIRITEAVRITTTLTGIPSFMYNLNYVETLALSTVCSG